ncbi:MAG: extensin family protein [Litorimonas sp.]
MQHLPWRHLSPEAPLGFATKTQFLRLSLSPSNMCMDMAESIKPLSSAAVLPHRPYTTNSRRVCGWDVARNVSQSANIKLSPDAVNMQCPLSVASYLWMREIDKIAKKDLGSSISEVIHYGTYSCRKQNGNTSGQWSEHAFANAWDVAGFKLKNGSVITVKNGWDDDSAEAQFLRRTRDTACKIFNVTLSPDFNAAHADHFHLDMGPTRTCR